MGGNSDSESDSRCSNASHGNDGDDGKTEVQIARNRNSPSFLSSSAKSENAFSLGSTTNTSKNTAAAKAAPKPSMKSGTLAQKTKPKWKASTKRFKKAPGAPKRFRSAFILFSQQKHKEIQAELALSKKTKTTGDGREGDASNEKLAVSKEKPNN